METILQPGDQLQQIEILMCTEPQRLQDEQMRDILGYPYPLPFGASAGLSLFNKRTG